MEAFRTSNLIMERLEGLFGQYPWECKFSYVETPKGDMEHQSAVFHIASAINGTTGYDWLLAHEMTHQWWGDCVTEEDWSDVWLSEGFATYGEPLWMETYGYASYIDYVVSEIMKPYLNSGEVFPLSSPSSPEQYWGYTTYQKGASVLHMLRMLMGDSEFFAALGDYFDAFEFGLTSTEDFQTHLENHYGDLSWFFDEWVHGWGYPVYDITYQFAPGQVQVTVHQAQDFGTFFTMPIEFLIEGGGQDTLVTMWNDSQDQTVIFETSFDPVSVTFDPSVKILSNMVLGVDELPSPPPGGTYPLWVSPNPCSGTAWIDWRALKAAPLKRPSTMFRGGWSHMMSSRPGTALFSFGVLPSGTYFLEVRAPGNLRQVARLLVLD